MIVVKRGMLTAKKFLGTLRGIIEGCAMLVLDPSKCSGCRRCETQCSFYHTGKVGRNLARIKVVKMEGVGLDFPVFCLLCKERHCMDCPQSAITVGPSGEIVVDPDLCIGCGTCEELCPIGAIEMHEDFPYVCDLCRGAPRCVKACTMGALSFMPDKKEAVSLKAQDGKFPPEDRRVRFALSSSQPMRETWVSARRAF
jgi:anaerobic carbon-monoxide dehydrogenase iron sulfur subunit